MIIKYVNKINPISEQKVKCRCGRFAVMIKFTIPYCERCNPDKENNNKINVRRVKR